MSFTLPSKLASPAASWERDVDVVVLGSGASGLAAALAMRPHRSVLVITKDVLAAGSTSWAQGGLAAVLDPNDSVDDHSSPTPRRPSFGWSTSAPCSTPTRRVAWR